MLMENAVFKHSFKTRLREGFGLAVYNTGRQQCEPAYTWGPAVRDHYLIHYVAGGRGRLFAEGKSYEAGVGDVFLITPERLVSYTADENDPWEYLWVGFAGSDAQGLVSLTGLSAEQPVLHLEDGAQAERLLAAIYEAVGSAAYQETRMCGGLYLFLAFLMEKANTPHPEADSARVYSELAVRYIEHNYSAPIGVDDIAAHVGVSRSHLYRVFIRHLGLSPNDFLTRFRMGKACLLLHDTLLSIGEVAGSVGFSDPLYFSRVFRRFKDMSPSEYKKSVVDR